MVPLPPAWALCRAATTACTLVGSRAHSAPPLVLWGVVAVVVVVVSNTDTTDRMSGILGAAEDRKSAGGGRKGAAAARPSGSRGEAGVRRGARTGLARPPSRTLGSTPLRTYLSWAVG